MKYYVPDLRLSVLLGKQTQFEDKLGGLPWGLPQEVWPICPQCENPMLLLAQLHHSAERLNLGKAGRVLYVFQCNEPEYSECTWDPDSGANACLVLEPEQLSDTLTLPPNTNFENATNIWSVNRIADYKEASRPEAIFVETEARVMRWFERDDKLRPQDAEYFLTEEKFWKKPNELGEPFCGTKLGSVPCWVQTPQLEGWEFLGQFSDGYFFYHEMPQPDEVGCKVGRGAIGKDIRYEDPPKLKQEAPRYISELDSSEKSDDAIWACEGPNFGDAGIGYVFARRDGDQIPECKFFWQCH